MAAYYVKSILLYGEGCVLVLVIVGWVKHSHVNTMYMSILKKCSVCEREG